MDKERNGLNESSWGVLYMISDIYKWAHLTRLTALSLCLLTALILPSCSRQDKRDDSISFSLRTSGGYEVIKSEGVTYGDLLKVYMPDYRMAPIQGDFQVSDSTFPAYGAIHPGMTATEAASAVFGWRQGVT